MITPILKGYLIQYIPIFSIIDFTVLVFLLILIGIAAVWLKGDINISNEETRFICSFLLVLFVITISYIYTPSPVYGFRKIMRFSSFGLASFIAPFIFIQSYEDLRNLFRIFIVVVLGLGLSMSAQLLYSLMKGELVEYAVRLSLFDANPIQVSRFLSVGSGMLFILFLKINGRIRIWLGIGILVSVLGMLASGSRGPLVSLFLSIIVFSLFAEKYMRKQLFPYFIAGLIFIVLMFLVLPQNLTERFYQLAEGQYVFTPQGVKRISTVSSRLSFWQMGLSSWVSHLKNFFIGLGAGGFSSLFIWRDFQWYPHNTFIEFITEQGLFGILTFIIFLVSWFNGIKNNYNSSNLVAVWVIATLVMFIAAMFSGDINENRNMWILFAISFKSSILGARETSYNSFRLIS